MLITKMDVDGYASSLFSTVRLSKSNSFSLFSMIMELF
jgi:hypothetical protein